MRKDYEDAMNTVACTMGLEATETITFYKTLEDFPGLSNEDLADMIRMALTPRPHLLEDVEY